MIQATWGFIVVSVIFWAVFFLQPPWTVENVILGSVPLVFVLFFGYRFWRARKENPQALSDDHDDY
ncbi:MAG: hypothetical protein WCW53_10675 [Syntrophales bacterium]